MARYLWLSGTGRTGLGRKVAENFIIVDMMAKAATDKATPEEAVAWAQKEIELIYKKWSAA